MHGKTVTVTIGDRRTDLNVVGIPLEAWALGQLLRPKWDKDKRGPPKTISVLATIRDRTKPKGQQISYIDVPALIRAAGYTIEKGPT